MMSGLDKSVEEYPRPNKRKQPKISPSLLVSSISESIKTKSESIIVNKYIETQVNLVFRSNIENQYNSLTSFHNRHSKSVYCHQAASWLKKEIEISGYKDKDKIPEKDKDKYKDIVDFDIFLENGLELKNVICNKQGETNKIIIICGHYDTVLGDNPEDTISKAPPGADDNASGVAAILEIARILFSIELKYTIRFVFFSGEEQGLKGSVHYSKYIKQEWRIFRLVINLDMVGEPGFMTTPTTIQIDVDKYKVEETCNKIEENDKESENFASIMKRMTEIYTNLKGEYGPVYASDYCPFEKLGYVVIGAYDGSAKHINPHYHQLFALTYLLTWIWNFLHQY